MTRLFPTSYQETLPQSEKKGSLLGSVLLICGSSIGVGIMPLPILTGKAGALPTIFIFVCCCVYMTITALLLLESSLLFKQANFISIANSSLNRVGRFSVFSSFLFLFYSLTTAYLAKGGELVCEIGQNYTGHTLSHPVCAIFLACLSGILIFLGPFIVDYLNRIFMLGFFLTYFFLITSGTSYMKIEQLSHIDWSLSFFIIPFIVTSFGYHNLVPSISNYLRADRKLALKAFLLSGIFLLLIYVIWIVGLLGILPVEGEISISSSFAQGEIVTQPLARLISSPIIQYAARYMAVFAIITSLLGQGLSVIDFLAESLSLKKSFTNRLFLCFFLFFPSCLCSQTIADVFFKALEFAGGVAAMIIFGVIPGILGWVNRYGKEAPFFRPIVRGGKPMLVAVIGIASFVIIYEIIKNI